MSFKKRILLRGMLLVVALAALGGVVTLLWNAVVPDVFAGARPIDYPHAFGLLVLGRILFGGMHRPGGLRHRHGWGRWQAMTPEEREQLRADGAGAGRDRHSGGGR